MEKKKSNKTNDLDLSKIKVDYYLDKNTEYKLNFVDEDLEINLLRMMSYNNKENKDWYTIYAKIEPKVVRYEKE